MAREETGIRKTEWYKNLSDDDRDGFEAYRDAADKRR